MSGLGLLHILTALTHVPVDSWNTREVADLLKFVESCIELRRNDHRGALGKFGDDHTWRCIPVLVQLRMSAPSRNSRDTVPLASFLVSRAEKAAEGMPLVHLVAITTASETLLSSRPLHLFQVRNLFFQA